MDTVNNHWSFKRFACAEGDQDDVLFDQDLEKGPEHTSSKQPTVELAGSYDSEFTYIHSIAEIQIPAIENDTSYQDDMESIIHLDDLEAAIVEDSESEADLPLDPPPRDRDDSGKNTIERFIAVTEQAMQERENRAKLGDLLPEPRKADGNSSIQYIRSVCSQPDECYIDTDESTKASLYLVQENMIASRTYTQEGSRSLADLEKTLADSLTAIENELTDMDSTASSTNSVEREESSLDASLPIIPPLPNEGTMPENCGIEMEYEQTKTTTAPPPETKRKQGVLSRMFNSTWFYLGFIVLMIIGIVYFSLLLYRTDEISSDQILTDEISTDQISI